MKKSRSAVPSAPLPQQVAGRYGAPQAPGPLKLPESGPSFRFPWDRVLLLVLSLAVITTLHFLFLPGFSKHRKAAQPYEKARILEVLGAEGAGAQAYRDKQSEAVSAEYRAVLSSGPFKGEEIRLTAFFANPEIENRFPRAGDRVLVGAPEPAASAADMEWRYDQFDRSLPMMWLGLAFVTLFILLGRSKGLAALLALILTLSALLLNFVPAVIGGRPILPAALIFCLFSIFVTLYLVLGAHEKTWVTVVGCFGGVLLAALLAVLMQYILHLNGVSGEESFMLYAFNKEEPLNLQGIIFAMILIGSLGAVMDVAMDLASSMYEIRLHAPYISRSALMKSGFEIGRDVMGTMANTLILAYAGSTLPTILIQILYSPTFSATINQESMVIEMLNALIGSMGLMLTIPLTSLIASLVYTRKHRRPLRP